MSRDLDIMLIECYILCSYTVNPPQNPVGTMPTIWNDSLATVGQKNQLLFNVRNSMGPGLTRMISALRTPAGRPVSAYFWLTFNAQLSAVLHRGEQKVLKIRMNMTNNVQKSTKLTNTNEHEQ